VEEQAGCRVLVVDDHPVVRTGVRQMLESVEGIRVTGEASGGYEALDRVRSDDFDVVLLDVSLPDMNGIDTLKAIRTIKPGVPVLMLSVYQEEIFAVRAMREGARGYLTKASLGAELVLAVQQVRGGGRYITASLAEKLADAVRTGADRFPHENLSLREFEVMRMIAQGKALRTIAELLHISPKTVTTYRSRILDKMGFKANEDIVLYASHHHLSD
jgi:two-component system invasion response regulator UvrY